MRAGCLPRHGTAERNVGDPPVFEQRNQKNPFVFVRVQGYVHAVAVIESHGAMHLGIADRAERKRPTELLEEYRVDRR